jgi:chemotaxis protein methyltransferase CheR
MLSALATEPAQNRAPAIPREDYARFCEFFYRKTGIMFGDNKGYFVERRLQERMAATKSATFRDYFTIVRFQASGEEMQSLVNAMTVNETYFYREDYQFEALVRYLLPDIIKARTSNDPIRIWSMPCSTGEEPYSIAMQILEGWSQADELDVEILASDIDSRVIAEAKQGLYSARSPHRLTPTLKSRYFTASGDDFRIRPELRGSIDFSVANIADNLAMRRFRNIDVIFCRNMLIYFGDTSRRQAVEALYESLRPRGYICLGHSESMSRISSVFRPCKFGSTILYQRPLDND